MAAYCQDDGNTKKDWSPICLYAMRTYSLSVIHRRMPIGTNMHHRRCVCPRLIFKLINGNQLAKSYKQSMTLQVNGWFLFKEWRLLINYEQALNVEQTLEGSVVFTSLPYITI